MMGVVVEVREASASLCATEESLPSERDHLARFHCQVREFDVTDGQINSSINKVTQIYMGT